MDGQVPGSLEGFLDAPGPGGELLALLAQLAPLPLPRAVLLEGPGEPAAEGHPGAGPEQALGRLIEEGHLRAGRGSISLPAEAAERIRAHLAGDPRDRVALVGALAVLHHAFPAEPQEFETWPRCRALLRHVLALSRRLAALGLGGEDAAWLETRAAEYARLVGEFGLAAGLTDAAFAAAGPGRSPRLAAALAYTQGRLHTETGQLGRAAESLDQALSLHLADPGPGSAEARRDQIALAEVVGEAGDLAGARELVETAISDHGEAEPDRTACLARRRLAWVLMREGDHEAAEAEYRSALEQSAALLPARHPDHAEIRSELGALLLERHDLAQAGAELRAAIEVGEPLLGARHPLLGVARSNLGGVLEGLGQLRAARLEMERALEIGEERLPAGHRAIWLRHRKLARVLGRLGEPRRALPHAEAAADISHQALGDADPDSARDQIALAELRRRLGEGGRARRAYRRGVTALEEADGAEPGELEAARLGYARSLLAAGSLPRARRQLTLALSGSEGEDAVREAEVRIELAGVLLRNGAELASTLAALGREGEAVRAREAAATSRAAVLEGLIADADLDVCLALARALGGAEPATAAEALGRAEAIIQGEKEGELRRLRRRRVALGRQTLAATLGEAGEEEAARGELLAALALVREDGDARASVLHDLGALAMSAGNLEGAEESFAEAAALARGPGGEELLATTLLFWGRVRFDAGDLDGAEALLGERLDLLRALPERDPLGEGVTLHDLADVQSARGEHGRAIELYREAAAAKREAGEGGQEATTLFVLAGELEASGDAAGTLDALERSLTLLRSLPAEERREAEEAETLIEIGRVHDAQEDHEGAIPFYREALDAARAAEERPILSAALFFLGRALERAGEEEAEPVYRERLALLRQEDEPDLEELAIALHDLADVLDDRGADEEAISLYRESVDAATEVGEIEGAAFTLRRLGRRLEAAGSLAEAAESYRRALTLLESLPERDPAREGAALHDLASVHQDRNELELATRLYLEAAERRGANGDRLGQAKSLLALGMAIMQGEGGPLMGAGPAAGEEEHEPPVEPASAAAALPHLEQADALLADAKAPQRLDAAMIATMIAMALESIGDRERLEGARDGARAAIEALLADRSYGTRAGVFRVSAMLAAEIEAGDLLADTLSRLRARADEDPGRGEGLLITLLRRVGRVAERRGDYAAAGDLYREHLERLRSRPEGKPLEEGIALEDLADARRKDGDPEGACELYREAALCFEEAERPRRNARALSNLAFSALQADGPELAREAARESVELLRAEEEPDRQRLAMTLGLVAAMEPEIERSLVVFQEADELLADHPEAAELRERLRQARERREGVEAEDAKD